MSSSNTCIDDSDIFICEAFREIMADPAAIEEKLGSEARLAIAIYLTQLPPEDKLDAATMANHITAFCQKPGNQTLNEWLGEIYDRLDEDGIDKLVKKMGDPGDEADAASDTKRMRANEGRDICQNLQRWADEVKNQSDRGTKNVSNP